MADESWLEYCDSDPQRETVLAVIEHGSILAASKALGKAYSTVHESFSIIRAKATLSGNNKAAEIDRPVPGDVLSLKGMSDMRTNSEGKPVWYKFDRNAEQVQEMLKRACKLITQDIEPISKIRCPRGSFDTDLIPWFQIGDAHLGMLAHEWEVGHNFDLKIAERELREAMFLQIERAPKTERCVINDLGDFTHYENIGGETEASGHALDYDGRFPKMIDVYIRLMKSIVEEALRKFKYVDIAVNQGNHSRTNDSWMAGLLRDAYRDNKRLHVLNNANVFIPYRMGNVFVLIHHGDKCKPERLADVASIDFRQDWGETPYHYLDGGHWHNTKSITIKGAIYEVWNNLAPNDKYANDGGWRSRQFLTTVLRSKTYGEQGRVTVTAEEVQDRLGGLKPGTSGQKRREVYSV